jgi:hypothetical protein
MGRPDLATHAGAGLGHHHNPALDCAVVVHQRGVVRVSALSAARSSPNLGARASNCAADRCRCSGRDSPRFHHS